MSTSFLSARSAQNPFPTRTPIEAYDTALKAAVPGNMLRHSQPT